MTPTRTAAKKATASQPDPAPEPERAPEPEHAPVDARQLRVLHGLLAAHGINGDVTRHDWLTVAVRRPIASASELSKVEAARLIGELEAEDAPEAHTASKRQLDRLRAPFKPEEVGKLPRVTCKACRESPRKRCDEHTWVSRCRDCGNSHSSAAMHIDYVGHADVTARLLDVDPHWTYRPFTAEEIAGVPPTLRNGLWIMLTVCGITRPGFGEGASGQQTGGDQVKVAIGDALRNAGMRFGVALDLWVKGDREWANAEKYGAEQMAPDDPAPTQDQPAAEWTGPGSGPTIARLIDLAGKVGTDLAGITAKWRELHGGLTVDELHHAPPRALHELAEAIETFQARHPPEAARA